MTSQHFTWFDRWVARQRHAAADKLLRPGCRLCDLGCGVDALFLREVAPRTRFRVGVDYQEMTARIPSAAFVKADIAGNLPFRSGAFDHVTLLAVIEHLADPVPLFREVYRVLVPGGSLIVTWPSAVVDPLLHGLMAIGVVSHKTEVNKHQPRRKASHWIQTLSNIGFAGISHRPFEFGLNNLLVAGKPGGGA